MRVAALLWMGLVAVGLVLVCWRMLNGKTLVWLINRAALAAVLVVTFACIADPAAVSAAWNVRHAREAGGKAQPLDLAYMRSLGSAALVPLAQLEQRPLNRHFRDRVTYVRERLVVETDASQAAPHGWVWRDARRLEAARTVLGPGPTVSAPARYGRDANARINPPPKPWPAAPLTPKVDQ
jgi:hypothetical protein